MVFGRRNAKMIPGATSKQYYRLIEWQLLNTQIIIATSTRAWSMGLATKLPFQNSNGGGMLKARMPETESGMLR
jgi:hypothetical protein